MTDAGTAAAGTLLHRVDNGVAWITLNRPDAGNAITTEMHSAMVDLLHRAHAEPSVRAVVIGAVGKHFCTGADLRSPQPGTDEGFEGDEPSTGTIMRTIVDGPQRLIASVLDCQKPVIAAVNGTAAGIGAHLVLACDLVVAVEEAAFIEVFVRRGILPDGAGAYLLPRLVGMQRAKELVLLGERLSAADACSMGMVNRVVPAADLDATVGELAARLAQGPTIALGLAKQLLNRSLDVDRASAFFEESMAQELVTRTADATEGIASFVERRPAAFRGQ
ncbi:MAG TPA: enoyl-CoA hydratase-related protein [Acidimicrobiales bacterium]|nr:enoyl-CoA hydratase-related protein [Acidimicrobiales bacterium]